MTKIEKDIIKNQKMLYNFALKICMNEEDAKDLMQDTILKALRFHDSFKPDSNVRAWLKTIMKNTYINSYNKKIKEPQKIDYTQAESLIKNKKESYSNFLNKNEGLDEKPISEEVIKALNELPADLLNVIYLCDIKNYSYEEIAHMVDIPIGTIRSRIHRGRSILRTKLQSYAEKLGYFDD